MTPDEVIAARKSAGLCDSAELARIVAQDGADAAKAAAAMVTAYRAAGEQPVIGQRYETDTEKAEAFRVWQERNRRAMTIDQVNHDDALFAQLCADDAEALAAHEDDMYFTRYGL